MQGFAVFQPLYTERPFVMRSSQSLILLCSVAAIALAFSACSGPEPSNPSPPAGGGRGGGRGAATGPVPVTIGTVEQKSMPIEIRVIGSAEAFSTVAVHAQIT